MCVNNRRHGLKNAVCLTNEYVIQHEYLRKNCFDKYRSQIGELSECLDSIMNGKPETRKEVLEKEAIKTHPKREACLVFLAVDPWW